MVNENPSPDVTVKVTRNPTNEELEKALMLIVNDYQHMSDTLKAAQARCSELLEQNRELCRENGVLKAVRAREHGRVIPMNGLNRLQRCMEELGLPLDFEIPITSNAMFRLRELSSCAEALQSEVARLNHEHAELLKKYERAHSVEIDHLRAGWVPKEQLDEARADLEGARKAEGHLLKLVGTMRDLGLEVPDGSVVAEVAEKHLRELVGRDIARSGEWRMIEDLQKTIDGLGLKNRGSNITTGIAAIHLQEMSSRIDSLTMDKRTLILERDHLAGQVTDLQTQLKDAESERYNACVERNQARSDKNQAEQRSKDDRLHTMNFDICQNELNEAKAKIRDLEMSDYNKSSAIRSLESDVEGYKERMVQYNTTLGERAAQLGEMWERLQRCSEALEETKQALEDAERPKGDLEARMAIQLQTISQQDAELSAWRQQVDHLLKKLQEAGHEIQRLKDEDVIGALRMRLRQLEKRQKEYEAVFLHPVARNEECKLAAPEDDKCNWQMPHPMYPGYVLPCLRPAGHHGEHVFVRPVLLQPMLTGEDTDSPKEPKSTLLDEGVSRPLGQQLEDERHRAEYAEQDLRDCVLALDGQPVPERLVRSQDGCTALRRVASCLQERSVHLAQYAAGSELWTSAVRERDDARKQIEEMKEQWGREILRYEQVLKSPAGSGCGYRTAGFVGERCSQHVPHPMYRHLAVRCTRVQDHTGEHVYVEAVAKPPDVDAATEPAPDAKHGDEEPRT